MSFAVVEASISDIHQSLASGEMTSKELILLYMERIANIDQAGPTINSVLEINPDALFIAEAMDHERATQGVRGPLHGVPILIKDNINTRDKMHTTAGSLAMANSFAPEDAFLVKRLRKAGAILLGKTNMTEWANFMTEGMPSGYSSRGGQVKNPYHPDWTPSGSSSGSGAAVASNFCTAAIGTETSGSIMSPSYMNSIVGIKPTVGLVSRSGIIPISNSQDTAGPMARTVKDAAILLSALTGIDESDPATWSSRGRFHADYTAFLNEKGLEGARIGINRGYYDDFSTEEDAVIQRAIEELRQAGATVIDDVHIPHAREDYTVLLHEFQLSLNAYLATLGPHAPMKTLEDIITFNHQHADKTLKYGQTLLTKAQYSTSGRFTDSIYLQERIRDLRVTQKEGIDKMIKEHQLDALFCPGVTDIAAVAGYPSIIVPAGYTANEEPVGIMFIGTAYSEPTLIKLAYAFEQMTKARKAPIL